MLMRATLWPHQTPKKLVCGSGPGGPANWYCAIVWPAVFYTLTCQPACKKNQESSKPTPEYAALPPNARSMLAC